MIELNINRQDDSTLQELIKATFKFYPVGFAVPNNIYSGYVDLKEIINVKINEVIAMHLPKPCADLIKVILEQFAAFKVTTEIESQFPNYALTVELFKRESDEIIIVYNLKLRLSLLTNYFTIFYDETIIHKNISSSHLVFIPLITNVLSANLPSIDKENTNFNSLKEIVESIFINYSYVSHYVLFKTKVKNAIPHGMEQNQSEEFPLYNFLFGNDYNFLSPPYLAP